MVDKQLECERFDEQSEDAPASRAGFPLLGLEDAALRLRKRLWVPPTFFGIVRQTLDLAYADIYDPDEAIKARLDELRKQFGCVLTSGGPDYADPITRFAYVYMYASAHADYLDGIIKRWPPLQEVLNRDKVSITCIGGGPGSDVLGFFKFVLERGGSPHIKYFILDSETAWADTWSDLDDVVTGSLRPSRSFQHFDVTDPTTYRKLNRPFESDIFTMIYFLSEVFVHKDAVKKFLDTCFARMKGGAQFIVIDFKSPALQNLIDQCAEAAGLEGGGEETCFFMDSSEDKSELQFYTDKFGTLPKIKSQVFYRVFRKR
jgi:hypothetical protein